MDTRAPAMAAAPRKAGTRSHLVLYAVAALAAAGLVAWLAWPAPRAPAMAAAIPVNTARAVARDVPVSLSALGEAQAWTNVTVFAQVSGKLLKVHFAEGSEVKAGQLLAEIDPAPFQAALLMAQGALKRDQALLANARLDLARYRSLQQKGAIAGQTVDTQAALVQQDEGTVLADQGALEAAAVNLSWCRITSPIDGRVGLRLVDPGNLVSASGSPSSIATTAAAITSGNASTNSGIVVIAQIRPIAVTFTVPEGDFQRLSDASSGFSKPLAVTAFSQETGAPLDTGELSIADNHVDPATGTVQLKARFPNAAHRLWPGQFVNIALTLMTLRGATTVPSSAINRGPAATFVYVVENNGTVSVRPVTVALTQGTTAVIASGLGPGQTVVTDGQMTLKADAPVRIVSRAPDRP